jgi:alpha-N-arabinofuranosidase
METVKIKLNKDEVVGEIAPEIYGGFVEHLGRNVYGGIYLPEDPTADADGFRKDVMGLIKELNTPITRYPGGCYTDTWCWEDCVGPDRPVRLDLAWEQKEPNTFGLHEFMRWARKVNTEPVITLNLSTRGIIEAGQLLEYCNFPGGTELSDRRRQNGADKPFNIRYWCLGNELYGDWEIGRKSAEQYGWLARETAKMMRKMDPEIKLILCGSPYDMEWNRTVLTYCYEYVDFISLHEVFNIQAGPTADYLRSIDGFKEKILKTAAVIEAVRLLKHSDRKVTISIDEWIIWDFDRRRRADEKWIVGPHLLEQDFTMPDALVAGELLSLFHNLADRVTMACIAQSVNVIAPIRTAPGGVSWKQSIFYPFSLTSQFGRGTALNLACGHDDLYGSAVVNHERDELVLFLTNRNLGEELPLHVEFEAMSGRTLVDTVSLHHSDPSVFNTPEKESLRPRKLSAAALETRSLKMRLPALSWNMVRIKLGEKQ